MASRPLPARKIVFLAGLALALVLAASLALVPSAHAATKADVVAKVEALGLPQHLMGVGYGVAKAVDFDEAAGDAIMGDIDRAAALLAGRSIYELGAKDSATLIELCAASLLRVGVQTEYAFNPAGGADITLFKDGVVIAKFNTRDSGVVRTGGEALPWGALVGAALTLTLAAACVVALRRGRKIAATAALSFMLAVPLALVAVPAFADPAPSDGSTPVTSVALTLTEPVAGQQASSALTCNPLMAEAGLAWEHGGQPFTGAFVEGEVYTAHISLVSDAPFSPDVAVTVNDQQVRPLLSLDNVRALQCSISFTAKPALKPIEGEIKVYMNNPISYGRLFETFEITVDGKVDERISGSCTWKGNGPSRTLELRLFTKAGWCFAGGQQAVLYLRNNDESSWEHDRAASPTKPGDTEIHIISEVLIDPKPPDFGGCTVVSLFGDDAPETEALRSFRDEALSQSSLGQGLTSLYYEVAPRMTAFLDDVPALKPAARAVVGWAAHAVT